MKIVLHHRNRRDSISNYCNGFTLVELMIVVAVIGLLAVIAYPSYNQYIMKARRTDARNAVLDLASRQERYFSVNNSYASTPILLGYGTSTTFPISITVSGKSYYNLSATITTAPAGFVAKATPVLSQIADTTCYSFQVDQTGTQANVDGGGTSLTTTGCW